MFKFGKTLIVVLGINQKEVATFLSSEINHSDLYGISYTDQKIIDILKEYDNDPLYSDLIFITTDDQSTQLFVNTNYNVKTLVKSNGKDLTKISGLNITWCDVDELPSLIKRAENNISD